MRGLQLERADSSIVDQMAHSLTGEASADRLVHQRQILGVERYTVLDWQLVPPRGVDVTVDALGEIFRLTAVDQRKVHVPPDFVAQD